MKSIKKEERTKATELVRWFLENGGKAVRTRQEITGKHLVYAVTNGENILAVGRGNAKRFRGLLQGNPEKHNKAFIVAATPVWSGLKNMFYYLNLETSDTCKQTELELHRKFKTFDFPDYGFSNLREVASFLWNSIKNANETPPEIETVMSLVKVDGDVLYVALKHPQFGPTLALVLRGYYSLEVETKI